MLMKLVTKVAKEVVRNPSHWIRNGIHRRWISQTKHCSKYLYGAQITLCPACTYSSVHHSSYRFQSTVKRKFNTKLVAFRYDLDANSEDFVLSDKMWDILRGEIFETFEGRLISAMDWEIMASMKRKPDLSLSYFKYLQKRNIEMTDFIKIQFCINCCNKHEEHVFECISELKGTDTFERNCRGRADLLVAISQTRDWKLCLKYANFGSTHSKTLVSSVLSAALKNKEYKIFLEIWNQSTNIIMLHGNDVAEGLFEGWQKGWYPIDLLFEVAKLGEIPFSDSQADILLNYCRNTWHEAVDVKYAETSKEKCVVCKDTIPTYGPIDSKIFAEMKKSVVDNIMFGRSIYYTSNPAEFKRFSSFIEPRKPFDLVVDALNLFHARGRADDWFYHLLKKLHLKYRWNILLVARQSNSKALKKLREFTHVFIADRDSQDDVYVILAAFLSGPECYIMTNDSFRDHFKFVDNSLQGYFAKWQEQRKIFHTDRLKFKWPPSFQWTCHETDHAWHIPYRRNIPKSKESSLSQELIQLNSRAFLCVQKKNYKPSDECLNFRRTKHSKPSVECIDIKSVKHSVDDSVTVKTM